MNSDASQAKDCIVGPLYLRQSLRHFSCVLWTKCRLSKYWGKGGGRSLLFTSLGQHPAGTRSFFPRLATVNMLNWLEIVNKLSREYEYCSCVWKRDVSKVVCCDTNIVCPTKNASFLQNC